MLPPDLFRQEQYWIEEPSPCSNVVVSCRSRFARNVEKMPFSPHATAPVLSRVRNTVGNALDANPYFADFYSLELADLAAGERAFLKERRLISKEMERGGASRAVYIRRDLRASIMVNEEDHLRIQCLEPGLQVGKVMTGLSQLDEQVAQVLPYAYHERFGYLTACPTNVGTALRVGVMMHLPALAIKREIEGIIAKLPQIGLTARGFHGERSENSGDFYQISNEVTLGRSVEDIGQQLSDAVGLIMEQETAARRHLANRGGIALQDMVWRSFGLLRSARRIDTGEAMKLLSRVRLGIDEKWFPALSHEALNRLMMEIQPAHLMLRQGSRDETEDRDIARAALIRKVLGESE